MPALAGLQTLLYGLGCIYAGASALVHVPWTPRSEPTDPRATAARLPTLRQSCALPERFGTDSGVDRGTAADS